jgi:hypothetical protein
MSEKGKEFFEGTPEELLAQIKEMERERLARQEAEPDRAFDCKCCGDHFVPVKTQYIFHKLCDTCFLEFDKQRMKARLSYAFGDGSVEGIEDADYWIEQRTSDKTP